MTKEKRTRLEKMWVWFKKEWKHIVPIFLTIAIIFQGISSWRLSNKIAEKEAERHEGNQALLLTDTKDFVNQYITNFIKYLAYENNKTLTTEFNIISSGDPTEPSPAVQENPTISRRFYVSKDTLHKFYECSPFIGFLPDEQNKIDEYFSINPTLSRLEKNIFNPKQTMHYVRLKKLIDRFNEDFNKYAITNKQMEEFEIKLLLRKKITTPVDWTKLSIRRAEGLIKSIHDIRLQCDALLQSFPELNIAPLKFIVEINVSEPFRKSDKKTTETISNDGFISPIKDATLYLDNKTYRFDYFIYFTRSIETDREKADIMQVMGETYVRLIN